MRDIDRWASIANEQYRNSIPDNAIGDNKDHSQKQAVPPPLGPSYYHRITVNQLIKLLEKSVPEYERDNDIKFISLKNGSKGRNAVIRIEVDDLDDEVQFFYDFK